MNNRIKEIRKYMGETQEEFARKLGLSRNYIGLIEIGKRVPSDRTISDICRVYDVNENWLRTGEGEMLKGEDASWVTASIKLAEMPSEIREPLLSFIANISDEEWRIIKDYAVIETRGFKDLERGKK